MAHEKAPPAAPASETVLAIRELVNALQRRNPSAEDTIGLSPERQAAMHAKTPPRRYRRVMLKGVNGATAIGIVCSEEGMKQGRIVRTENYRLPPGMLKHQGNGGLVPDGIPIARNKEHAGIIFAMADSDKEPDQMTVSYPYLRWKLETFQWLDLREWNGRELKAHYCDPAGRGLDTPWEEPEVKGDQAAE